MCRKHIDQSIIDVQQNNLHPQYKHRNGILQYELAPQPPSLFVDGQMRKTDKIALGKDMKSTIDAETAIPKYAIFVIDGGFLLHAVVWPKPAMY